MLRKTQKMFQIQEEKQKKVERVRSDSRAHRRQHEPKTEPKTINLR